MRLLTDISLPACVIAAQKGITQPVGSITDHPGAPAAAAAAAAVLPAAAAAPRYDLTSNTGHLTGSSATAAAAAVVPVLSAAAGGV